MRAFLAALFFCLFACVVAAPPAAAWNPSPVQELFQVGQPIVKPAGKVTRKAARAKRATFRGHHGLHRSVLRDRPGGHLAARHPATIRAVAPPGEQLLTPKVIVETITAPVRYIAGRLVCALNVNAELARRGIRGTGSASAKSFLAWGRASPPVPGAVAVYHRGRDPRAGHAAIVSRVRWVNGRAIVHVWNPGRRGWREVIYPRPAIAYRVAA